MVLLLAPALAFAAGVNIVAVVNGKAITSTMLENRIKLIFSSSNIPDNGETRKRFTNQILDTLVDEAIEQQEAKNSNVTVTPEDMSRAIADLEQRNRMAPGSFEKSLTDHGIDKDSALEQIRARLLWQKLSLQKLRSRVSVSESELQEGLEQFARKQNRREYQLSEIVLPVPEDGRREEIHTLANRIVAEVRKGGDFSIFARQFSQSGTALQGGETGWIPEERVEPAALKMLSTLDNGQVTDPFETQIGYKIYKLNNRYDPKDVDLTVKQLQLNNPLPEGAQALFAEAVHNITGCANVDEVAQNLKSQLPESAAANLSNLDLGQVKLTDISTEFRDAVAALNVDQHTPVLNAPTGLYVFVVCSRSASSNTLPDPDKVRDLIMREKLDLEARRYLSQLRRSAFIEKR